VANRRTENADHCYGCGRSNLYAVFLEIRSSPVPFRRPCCLPDLLLYDTCLHELHSGPVSTISSLQRKPPKWRNNAMADSESGSPDFYSSFLVTYISLSFGDIRVRQTDGRTNIQTDNWDHYYSWPPLLW